MNVISAIIIARNEASRISGCIKSVAWADEIIIVDNGSTDETAKIAQKFKTIVIEQKIHDFARIRDIGAMRAKGKWLLYIDADEVATEELRNEVQKIVSSDLGINAYFIPRQNYYLGKLWPTRDGMVRLIRKNALVRWEGILHEHAVVKGETGILKSNFIHDTHRTLEEMVAKTNEWSVFEAILRLRSGHPPVVGWRLLRVMMTAFIHSYITEGGWKAGTVGLIESIYQAFSIFITYAKLWEMQKSI